LECWNTGIIVPEKGGFGIIAESFLVLNSIMVQRKDFPPAINIPLFHHSIIPDARHNPMSRNNPMITIGCGNSETYY
jgi:hypothetical protein